MSFNDVPMRDNPMVETEIHANDVLEHALRGTLNKQAADDLGICERNLKQHRTGMPSVGKLARLAAGSRHLP
jgi:FixJ family two-component response regulator